MVAECEFLESIKVVASDDNIKLVADCTAYEVIKKHAFLYKELDEVILSKNLKVIELGAFKANKLKELKLPIGLKKIGRSAFENNELELVEIPNSVESLFGNSFDSNVILKNELVIEDLITIFNKINRRKISNVNEFYEQNSKFQYYCSELLKVKLRNSDKYDELLSKIEKIYYKTRFECLPSFEVLNVMSMELIDKFDLMIWKKISLCEIFFVDINSINVLCKMIEVFGLFEKDKYVYNRLMKFMDIMRNGNDCLLENQYCILLEKSREIGEDYIKDKIQVLRLKEGMVIPEELSFYLKNIITKDRYKYLKGLTGNSGKIVNTFLKNNYEVVDVDCYRIKNNTINKVNIDVLKRMFGNYSGKFNESAYLFLVKYFKVLLEDEKLQTMVSVILDKFMEIKDEYYLDNKQIPTLKQCYDYCFDNNFKYSFGNKELATLVMNAGVSTQEVYQSYEKLYEQVERRKLSTLIRRDNIYNYNGIQFRGRILRSDDAMAMLIGEDNHVGDCYRFGRQGETAMLHGASNVDGGVFEVSYLKDGRWIPLGYSWDWQNEGVYCHDNVVATLELKNHLEYKDIVMDIYKKDAQFIIKTSSEYIDEYIKNRLKLFSENNYLEEEQQKIIMSLSQLSLRQKIKVVTVGDGNGFYDDLVVRNYFPRLIDEVRQPKNYNGYSDANRRQFIIWGNEQELISENKEYQQISIYRDERRIFLEIAELIKTSTLKKIYSIRKSTYIDEDIDNFKNVNNGAELAIYYGIKNDDLNIVYGEDWYIVYIVVEDKMMVVDMARGIPRISDEEFQQVKEFEDCLATLSIQEIEHKNNRLIKKVM